MMRPFETDTLIKIIESRIKRDLYFTVPRELAVISGAGIAGLAISLVLRARGFNVVIAEKRRAFTRFNVINLDVETQRFLNQFGLLKEFEQFVAARIKTHMLAVVDHDGTIRGIESSNVSDVTAGTAPFKPESFDKLFDKGGIYSVQIKTLQTFLAEKALDAGVRIFGGVEVQISSRTKTKGVSKVQIKPMILQPNLFFIAEGTRSTTAELLEMEMKVETPEPSVEHWIFGNVKYTGTKTVVVSLIDKKNMAIANVIFNALIQEVNIAVTSKERDPDRIKNRILDIVELAFNFAIDVIDGKLGPLTQAVEEPVEACNKQRKTYSIDNAFCIGDAAGHSSPLAGLGGTLALTLVPYAIQQLVDDYERNPIKMRDNFNIISKEIISTWYKKSAKVKTGCFNFFKSEVQTSNQGNELARISMVPE